MGDEYYFFGGFSRWLGMLEEIRLMAKRLLMEQKERIYLGIHSDCVKYAKTHPYRKTQTLNFTPNCRRYQMRRMPCNRMATIP